MIRAATLNRHRLQIHRTRDVAAASGGTKPLREVVEERYASIEPLSARELVRADRTQSRATHVIRMRYQRGGITSKDLLVEMDKGGTVLRRFEIESILNVDERDVEYFILAIESA